MENFHLVMFVVVVFCILVTIFFNMGIYKFIVYKAIKNHIKPKLDKEGFIILQNGFPGLFSSGAFKGQLIPGVYVRGYPVHNTYVDIYCMSIWSNTKKIITAKISTRFLSIQRVEYAEHK